MAYRKTYPLSGIISMVISAVPQFYLTYGLILLTGISLQSVGNISIVYMEDLGLRAGFIAITATILGTIGMTLETVMIPLLANKLFGTASYTKL